MTTKTFAFTAIPLLLIFGLGMVALQNYNRGLRERIGEMSGPGRQALHLREENQRLKQLIAQTKQNEADAEQAMAAELVKAREELGEGERNRQRQNAEHAARTKATQDALATNRDPQKGPVRIEHFQNLGRGTPASAFQTLVWAAVNGDDDILAGTILIGGPARAQIEEFIAGLPPEGRAKYHNPEKLVSLFIAADIFKGAAAEIRDHTNENPDRVILNVRAGDKARDARMPMQRMPDGWRLAIADAQVKNLLARLRDAPAGRE